MDGGLLLHSGRVDQTLGVGVRTPALGGAVEEAAVALQVRRPAWMARAPAVWCRRAIVQHLLVRHRG